MTKRKDLPEDAKEEFRTLSPGEMTDRAWDSLGRIADAERKNEPAPDNLSANDPLRAVGTLSSPAEDDDEEVTSKHQSTHASKPAGEHTDENDG